jgi:hypothetical protein
MNQSQELTLSRKLVLSSAAALLLFLLLGVLAVAGELLLRAIGPKSDGQRLGIELENSARVYGLRPNARATQVGVSVALNSLGFREREYPRARVPGVRRIAVLGDSYTFGTGVEFADIYSKRLETQLNRSSEPFEVINFGVGGYNTKLELATWREQAVWFAPDLVILGYVLNDSERRQADVGRTTGAKEPSLLNGLHHHAKMSSMLYRYLAPKIGAVFGLFGARYAIGSTEEMLRSFDDDAPGWIDSRNAILQLAAEVRATGADFMVVVFPIIIDFTSYPLRPIHEKIVHFCRKNGIDVIDLLPRMRPENASDLAVFLDGHPNARAHVIFAEEIHRHLRTRYLEPKLAH